VTDRGGPREVVEDGVTGRVLPPRDPALWADATSALLDDPARRRAMGERAHAVASVHDAAYAAGASATTAQRSAAARPDVTFL